MHRISSTLLAGSTLILSASFITMLMTVPRSSTATPVLIASNVVAAPEAILMSEVASSTLRESLIRLSLDAPSLAAAGISAQSVPQVVGAMREQLATSSGLLNTLDIEIGQAQNAVDQLERRIRAGTDNEGDLQTLASARTALATATSSRTTLLTTLTTAAVAGHNETARARLEAIRSSSAWELGTEYRVVARTEAEWVALRDALAHERWATSHNYELDPEPAALLAQVRNDQAVAAAISNIQANGPAVLAAWNTATQ